jgi:alpha-L-arabinofuranosidase
MLQFRAIALVLTLAAIVPLPSTVAEVTLKVDATHPSHEISPRLVGIFLEDINFGVDGGLNAELVKNGAFEFPSGLMGWKTNSASDSSGAVELRNDKPAYAASPHYLRLAARKSVDDFGVVNEGFRGMGVRAGENYLFSTMARANSKGAERIRVSLIDEKGEELASTEVTGIGSDWSLSEAVLTPNRTCKKARLVVTAVGDGPVDLDMVSLCPEKTWKNRPHGMRADLVQMLADLRPAFFRFPGGCIVEGSQLADRYQWKQTIGDRADRKLNFNRWNTVFRHRPAPDYYQSQRIGFFEYFLMAEDIDAEPLPIINCGMACQFQSGEMVPLEELQPYIDDALDLVEFANGPVTSEWGAKRAAMGHPEPFGLKLLGVGNEQWGPEYFERYQIFAKAIKEKYPEIELVSGSGPFPADRNFHYAWPRLRELNAEIVDEHCYAMPDWFLRAATRYDDYDRNGPKVFMGEYAAQSVDITSPDNRNNLLCALAEAAFLTGIERNSDIVVMSSYAPLIGHIDAWQWRPNLIWFDNLDVVATPNYYVQQMFATNQGDVIVPVEITDSRPVEPSSGRIGLATDQASVEFKDIRVERDGKTLFTGDELTTGDMTTFRGRWTATDGVVKQQNAGDTARTLFGDHGWKNYTLSLKARKLDGPGGIGLIVRNSDGGSFLEWMLGGHDNQSRLQANVASHSEDNNVVQKSPGRIEIDRWYDVKLELNGDAVRCYLDGDLIHEATVSGPNLPRLYAVASRDEDSGELIVKIVNPTDLSTDVAISLEGVDSINPQAELTVISGEPDEENSLEAPHRVVPKSRTVEVPDTEFRHTSLPHSLSILRIKSK